MDFKKVSCWKIKQKSLCTDGRRVVKVSEIRILDRKKDTSIFTLRKYLVKEKRQQLL